MSEVNKRRDIQKSLKVLTRDHEYTRIIEILRELLRIECGGRYNQAEVVFAEPRDVFHQPEQHVCVQRTLVGFVNHHHTVALVVTVQKRKK